MLISVGFFAPEACPREGRKATLLVGFTRNYDMSQGPTEVGIFLEQTASKVAMMAKRP